MLPDSSGRYCNGCQKSVIDFTAKTDEEIQQFITNNSNQRLCGRFKNTQIQRIVIDLPQNIFSIKMPLWMQFLVVCIIIFSICIFPFETTIAGKSSTPVSYYQDESVALKSTDQISKAKKRKRKKNKITYTTITVITMGAISMPPITIGLDTLPDTSFQLFAKEVSYAIDKSTHLYTSNKSLPQKETPGPTPFMPAEFILPSILLIRKESNNQRMD